MKKGRPLWLRALKDPAAIAWRAQHAEEFPPETFLPDPISYSDKMLLDREKAASVIAAGMPYDSPEHQRMAELVLEMPPRKIAELLGISRQEAYVRARAIKELAIRKWHRQRAELVMARAGGARGTPLAALAPEGIALKSVRFTLGEKTRMAYLVQLGAVRSWLDEHGSRFTPEVQVILSNLELYRDAFESLEITEYTGGGLG